LLQFSRSSLLGAQPNLVELPENWPIEHKLKVAAVILVIVVIVVIRVVPDFGSILCLADPEIRPSLAMAKFLARFAKFGKCQ